MISGASDEELDIAIARANVLLELQPKIDELKKENQELKKQLEAKETQQKEFIEWLEEKIKVTEDKLDKYDELVMQGEETDIEYYESMINKGIFDAYKVCLSKYKETIGGK